MIKVSVQNDKSFLKIFKSVQNDKKFFEKFQNDKKFFEKFQNDKKFQFKMIKVFWKVSKW